MSIALIVHGGAGDIAPSDVEPHRRGVDIAARRGWEILRHGGNALEAVEAVIVLLEDDPAFDAGFGSVLNRDGQVEMDASIMDGRGLEAGAVAGIQHVKNPIRLANQVLQSGEHTFLIGSGAERFAQERGIPLIANRELIAPAQLEKWHQFLDSTPQPPEPKYVAPHGTVGCVAVDNNGNVAAGTSTGGTRFKRPGRVGDSPLIGCGVYADNLLGGASTTGWGEYISRVVLSKFAVDALARTNDPQQAANMAIEQLARRVGGQGGIIIADKSGQLGFAFNAPRMALALVTRDMTDIVASC